MKTAWMKFVFLTVFCLAGWVQLQAQEVVHALTGVVTAMDKGVKSITVQVSDGTQEAFSYAGRRPEFDLDKAIRAGTMEPAAFNQVGDHVIVYYCGDNNPQTVVAIRDLGKTPLAVSAGTVIHGSRKRHTVTIKTAAGASQSYQIARNASVETADGVIGGPDFDPARNSHVTVKYRAAGKNNVAQFIREDSL